MYTYTRMACLKFYPAILLRSCWALRQSNLTYARTLKLTVIDEETFAKSADARRVEAEFLTRYVRAAGVAGQGPGRNVYGHLRLRPG